MTAVDISAVQWEQLRASEPSGHPLFTTFDAPEFWTALADGQVREFRAPCPTCLGYGRVDLSDELNKTTTVIVNGQPMQRTTLVQYDGTCSDCDGDGSVLVGWFVVHPPIPVMSERDDNTLAAPCLTIGPEGGVLLWHFPNDGDLVPLPFDAGGLVAGRHWGIPLERVER